MRAVFVVQVFPFLTDIADLIQGREQVRIEHFVSIAFVKSFDKRILVGFAGLDVSDLNTSLLAPVDECLSTKLRAVIQQSISILLCVTAA